MKKVFISVPMKDRTKENIEKSIEKIKQYAKLVIDDELEFVNTEVQEEAPYETQKQAVWYLGKSLEILSTCDIIMVPSKYGWYSFNGCEIEKEVSEKYGICVIEYSLYFFCRDIFGEDVCVDDDEELDDDEESDEDYK